MNIVIYDNYFNSKAIYFAELATNYLTSKNVICWVKNQSFDNFQNKIASPLVELIDDKFVVKEADFIITFGGDGTILGAVKQYIDCEIPIMGFNVGKLGFLAEFDIELLNSELDNLLLGKLKTISKSAIKTSIISKHTEHSAIALNDIVIAKSDSKMLATKILSNEQYVGDYRTDGIIISTPTGSTAYSLSCGGPIITPDADVFCITPIAPHSLTIRPLVIPNNKIISLQIISQNSEASVVVDGFHISQLANDDTIYFELYDKKIKLIVPTERSFFDVLRNKLLWAEYSIKI
jgi:NAD+ kinase